MLRRTLLALLLALPLAAGQPLAYQDGSVPLAGYLARPAAAAGKVPGVLVIHQWMGVTDHERMISDRLAGLGYVALAADIYGAGVRPGTAPKPRPRPPSTRTTGPSTGGASWPGWRPSRPSPAWTPRGWR